ncbi:MAG TPA: hypothetical protein PK677_10175 [Acidiphilium sp.]|nr:MAG: hypothetical protein B7X48_01600 [Acidiphilium sp. 34-60-192]HQT88901.1 hypothetical protein [Acidiphilium sp.]HQU24965.1 hypothetical protein [Acidiphilium sp.]
MSQFAVTLDDAAMQAGLARLSGLLADPAPLLAILGQRLAISSQRRFDVSLSAPSHDNRSGAQ